MPNQYLEYGHKDSVFVEKMPNLSAQAQKFWILMKKRLHWATVVREPRYIYWKWPKFKLIEACLFEDVNIRLAPQKFSNGYLNFGLLTL